MKQINKLYLILIISGLLLTSCNPYKHYEKGNYDRSLNLALKKLKKKPNHYGAFELAKMSYEKANEENVLLIQQMKSKASDKDDTWPIVLGAYSSLITRQARVHGVETDRGDKIDVVDYQDEYEKAKLQAAEFYYNRGMRYLESKDMMDARLAHADFENVRKYNHTREGIFELLNEAEAAGTTNFYIQFVPITRLPSEVEGSLHAANLSSLNKKWEKFHTTYDYNTSYHYTIKVEITSYDLALGKTETKEYTETKTVQDGHENVKLSNGKTERRPKMIEVSCRVQENVKSREVKLNATAYFIDNLQSNTFHNQHINGNYTWTHSTVAVKGNQRAISDATKAKMNNKEQNFPSDIDMLNGAVNNLHASTRLLISTNRRKFR
jgi:hypothetical protein